MSDIKVGDWCKCTCGESDCPGRKPFRVTSVRNEDPFDAFYRGEGEKEAAADYAVLVPAPLWSTREAMAWLEEVSGGSWEIGGDVRTRGRVHVFAYVGQDSYGAYAKTFRRAAWRLKQKVEGGK